MKVTATSLPGVLLIEPRVMRDERGAFAESFRMSEYAELGIPDVFVQDNISWSAQGVLRGLHYQHPRGQAKLITTVYGAIYDVAVDMRPDSPTFLQWVGTELSSERLRQLYIPVGFAHGFVVTSHLAVVSYKCSEYYAPQDERCVRWDDPQLNIQWPIETPRVSEKDAAAPLLAHLGASSFTR